MNLHDNNANVLLVDDQPNNLLALESILSEMPGLTLTRATSGVAALRHLLEHEFAVVLLDVQMPELDGFETAALVRQRERSRETPIIFLTALSRSETNVYRGYELGAVDYIFKPFNPDILRSKVNVFVQLFRQREAIKRQAQELARLSRQTELILNSAAEGLFGVNLQGLATFVNPAAARMIGRRPPDVTGHEIHSLLHPTLPGVATCEIESCRLNAAMHGENVRDQIEDTFFRDDGSSFPVEFCASPMYDDETREPLGSVITFRDVTERRAAARAAENERRYREAEAQNRAKDNFLATLSHELRTPMTSILGWVQFLRAGPATAEELEEALRMIETSARLQKHLIDDMLDVSRIVLGKFQVDLRPTRLSEVVEAAVTTARPSAQQRDIRLVSHIDHTDDLVEADANRLQQVIGNILGNAIKFTDAGKEVDLRLERIEHTMRISVADQGEGIESSFLPHVFERLQQAEGAAKRSGLGLGLAIARHIVELHHGEIPAESEGLGKGARFSVTLPLMGYAVEAAPQNEPAGIARA
jgi:PAS domain S-box-containing protein